MIATIIEKRNNKALPALTLMKMKVDEKSNTLWITDIRNHLIEFAG